MTTQRLIAALALPVESQVNQRIPKARFLENGAPTAADRRAIQDGIEEVLWVAALKPNAIGVPTFRDLTREYLEIAVLTAKFWEGAKTLASWNSFTGPFLTRSS